MPPADQNQRPSPRGVRRFATTRWSIVLAAGRPGVPDSRQALAELCETYWYPLYAYVRRRGYRADQAQDLTQAFFAQLLEKDSLKVADPQRGKFRSFLLASLNHFLANQWRDDNVRKLGVRQVPLSLDLKSGEGRYALEPSHELTAEKIYQRQWAMTTLQRALSKLRDEFAGRGKLELFEHLKSYLIMEKGRLPYRQIAAELEMTEGAVKVAVHRLRRRCRELLREEIAQTVADPEQIDDELRELFTAISQ